MEAVARLDLVRPQSFATVDLASVERRRAATAKLLRRGVAARWCARAGWRAPDLLCLSPVTRRQTQGRRKEKK
ncbi:hypothetical protein JCGZ_06490 [Jatropha curcas]|uniref:Uncharacterized protein n=1 Tax=Jatropha curcas TaxID=180498 RepID=A0A067LE83_JATCU|nr:hypothetical protein JCGZ_06490 [Jatropha curcas]